ncbi:MAG: glycosyltransferase family 4 protein [Alphaproteobacteria bacterium]|nr:glycosyltransferase family 4 protein [Alphaproteobacteria bacterium]
MTLVRDLASGARDQAREKASGGEGGKRSSEPGRPLRILMPSYRSDPFTGGQGVYLRHVTKALADLGHKVDVISGPPYPQLDQRVGLIKLPSLDLYSKPKNWLGVPSYPSAEIRDWIDVGEYWSHVFGGFGEPRTFGARLARWMRLHRADYDVVHDNQTLAFGLLDIARMGIPVVGTLHHPITMDRRIAVDHAPSLKLKLLIMRWYSFLRMQKKVARRLAVITVASENTKKDAARDFGLDPAAMHVIYLGIDAERFRPMPGIERSKRRLMATASADVPLKGLVYLVRAYALLLKRYPDLELTVVGRLREGPTAQLLKELGIIERVRFVSGLTDEDIARLYAEATIAVAPSVYEGFGFPPGEAMACGVPVVSTTGGSLPEIVGDAGLTVPPKDSEALAAAIARLLDDEALRTEMGERGRRRIHEKFLWSRTAQELTALYRNVIANADARSQRA